MDFPYQFSAGCAQFIKGCQEIRVTGYLHQALPFHASRDTKHVPESRVDKRNNTISGSHHHAFAHPLKDCVKSLFLVRQALHLVFYPLCHFVHKSCQVSHLPPPGLRHTHTLHTKPNPRSALSDLPQWFHGS